MITWDSSGCMSRESVGVTHYRRHTNRLINITVAHLLTIQIHHAMHQQSKTLRLNVFKVYRMEIGCDGTRGNWHCAPARLGRGQTAAACVRLLGVATAIEPDRPLGTLTSLNDQVGLNVRRLLLHLHAVSQAPNSAGGQKWVAVDAAPAQDANGSWLKAAFWCFSHISWRNGAPKAGKITLFIFRRCGTTKVKIYVTSCFLGGGLLRVFKEALILPLTSLWVIIHSFLWLWWVPVHIILVNTVS